jgi:hypothetical protein
MLHASLSDGLRNHLQIFSGQIDGHLGPGYHHTSPGWCVFGTRKRYLVFQVSAKMARAESTNGSDKDVVNAASPVTSRTVLRASQVYIRVRANTTDL